MTFNLEAKAKRTQFPSKIILLWRGLLEKGGQGLRQKKGVGKNNKLIRKMKVIFMAGVDLRPGNRNFGHRSDGGEAGLNINALINPVILS